MLVLSDLQGYRPDPLKPLVMAIGNFDGVHRGHGKLLDRVTGRAKALGGNAAAFTFRDHPQHILHPSSKPPLLTSVEHKLFLLEQAGLNLCFMLPFTPEFSHLEPEIFVQDLLVSRLGVRELYLGHNARFGRDRKGDASMMRELSLKHGFVFGEIAQEEEGGRPVSSSRIRELIREGRLEEAETCLGRPFSVFGRVVRGDDRGSGIGFPTANFEIASEILPPFGVYPVRVREMTTSQVTSGVQGVRSLKVGPGGWQEGVLNYGYRPTFHLADQKAVPEVHLLDFDGNLYGKDFEIVFYPRIRGEIAFSDVEALKNQIETDIRRVRKVLARGSKALRGE